MMSFIAIANSFPGGSDGIESAYNVGDLGSLGWEGPLEEGMATHSRILTWRFPMDRGVWYAGFMGSRRFRHN